VNKYLTKIVDGLDKEAAIGMIGKALIKTKLGPALKGATRAGVTKLETLSRVTGGSKVMPDVFSNAEKARHMDRVSKLAPKLTSGMDSKHANKLLAVAARAKRMGVV
jgi:hypothetical protein